MNKKDIRQTVFASDTAFSAMERAAQSEIICGRIESMLHLTGNVLCFMPLADEVDIRPLFDVIRRRGGRVILPYCVDRQNMILKQYDKDAELKQDAMHVLSPKHGAEVLPCMIDEALIPAVALTNAGNRLGRGGGFYDRLLPNLRSDARKVGVCFQNRVLADIPVEKHDALVDCVISCDVHK